MAQSACRVIAGVMISACVVMKMTIFRHVTQSQGRSGQTSPDFAAILCCGEMCHVGGTMRGEWNIMA